jgi:hypothetical protein
MAEHESIGRELAKGAGALVAHTVALVVGFALMIVGVALGVTIVALPVGLAVGFAGLLLFLWGLFGRSQGKPTPPQPPNPR